MQWQAVSVHGPCCFSGRFTERRMEQENGKTEGI